MENVIEIIYKKQPKILKITCEDKVFDVTRIEDFSLEQWISPFFSKGIRWKGLYEELKIFIGSESFILCFDSDDDSFKIVKHALSEMPVKLVGTKNTVTIVYSETPVRTKIIVNGHLFDTDLIQNRYIDEWVNPFQVRGIRWKGIFKELEKFIGTDVYTLYFVGEQKFMDLLIDNCPEKINIFYRGIQTLNRVSKNDTFTDTASSVESNLASKINMEHISDVAGRTVKTIKQSIENTDNNVNTNRMPAKNSFIRNHIMTLCAVCTIVLLFLPFASFSATTTTGEILMVSPEISVSGFETMFGIKEIRMGSNNSIFAFLLLVVPILIIGLNYIKQLRPFQKRITVGASLLGLIAEIITLLDIRKLCKTFIMEEGIKLRTSLGIGFFCILIAYILTIVIGLIVYHGVEYPKKKKEL